MSDFTARVLAQLDTSQAESTLNRFLNNRRQLNIDVNVNSASANITNLLRQMQSQAQNAGRNAGSGFANAFNSNLNRINVNSGMSAISNMQRTLKSLRFDHSSIDTITQDLDRMALSVNNITTRMNGNNLNLTVHGVDELGRAVTVVKQFDAETGRIATVGKTISQSFGGVDRQAQAIANSVNRIRTAIDSGGIESSIARVNAQFEKLGSSGHPNLQRIQQDITTLRTLQSALNNSASDQTLIANYQQFDEILARVRNNLTTVSYETKAVASSLQIKTLDNQIAAWMEKNSRATKEFGASITDIRQKLAGLGDNAPLSKLKALENQFKSINVAATQMGLKGKSFGDTFKGAFSSITRYISASTLIYASIRAIREGIGTIVDLDTALIDLQKTTTATASQLQEFYYSANDTAKVLGVSTKQVIQSAADWSHLGYSIKDAQEMAEVSSVFSAISPDLDIEQATDGLVSSMKAFGIEAEDALDGVASKINIIGNTQAVSNGDIVNILTRASSAMAEANNTLEETIALGTAATEITRDADSVGNALKTISMRIRGYDEETEEYIGGVEQLSGDIADLTKTAATPGGISLFSDEAKTEYKSTTQLLREISQIYDQLTDKQQAGLLEALAGKRQGQIVAAILNNFETVEKSLESMGNSAGNAMKEMDTIQQSLEYKLNALKETAVGIFQNIFSQENIGGIVDALTSLLSIIDSLIEKFGAIPTLAAGIAGGFTLFKNVGRAKMFALKCCA